MTKVIKVIIPILISIIILLLGLFFGVNNNRILEGRIKQWENEGTRYIKRINGLVSSNCGWGVKREAMFATEKILDDSSISVLVSQLHYRGHWWQYWWDYEEVNQAEIFREDVMHILRRYGNKALKLILKDIERNGPRKTSKNVILVIGLLKTEAAAKELKKLKSDPQWKEQLKTIEQSLKLLTEAPPKVNEFSLKKEEVNGAIEELKTSLDKPINLAQEANFGALIVELGKMRIEQIRPDMKKIAETKSEILKTSSIKAIGQIGNPEDISFIAKYVDDKDIDVRREAITAIGLFKRKEIVPILEKVLKKKYEAPRNKKLAREALQRII
jgi:HEAT repeat protein